MAVRAERIESMRTRSCHCGEHDELSDVRAGQAAGEVAERRVSQAQRAAAMKSFLLKLFTWWNSQTFGTQFWTWMYGEKVGEDEFGNRYYRTQGGKIDPALGFERRWVIYQRLCRSLDHTAVLAWLDAPHGRHAADAGEATAARVAEAASAQYDRHAGAYRPPGSTLAAKPPSESDRRLQGVEPRKPG